MEVWALEAYGAAYTLQEMLTVMSDDTIGRTQRCTRALSMAITDEGWHARVLQRLVKEIRRSDQSWARAGLTRRRPRGINL